MVGREDVCKPSTFQRVGSTLIGLLNFPSTTVFMKF